MTPASAPPILPGVRYHHVQARGVRFHVAEAGAGRPVVALHGWPQHHWVYRDLLAAPPSGLRVIAPDLPGYGWSGPAPHRWGKEDVAADVIALIEALGLDDVLLVGHDWGGFVGFLVALARPDLVRAFVPLNIAHPFVTPAALRHLPPMLAYQPFVAALGVPLARRTRVIERMLRAALRDPAALGPDDLRCYGDAFRTETAARAGRDTYRTFLTRELPASLRHRERRRLTVPTRALFGTGDVAVHPSLAAPPSQADDYTLEQVDGVGHFIVDERPDLVRAKLVAVAAEFPPRAAARAKVAL